MHIICLVEAFFYFSEHPQQCKRKMLRYKFFNLKGMQAFFGVHRPRPRPANGTPAATLAARFVCRRCAAAVRRRLAQVRRVAAAMAARRKRYVRQGADLAATAKRT